CLAPSPTQRPEIAPPIVNHVHMSNGGRQRSGWEDNICMDLKYSPVSRGAHRHG
ncbi:hypothetical protein L9F63_009147, partial [Diploptera punctata]